MSSFFTIPGAQKKRKRAETNENPKKRFATSSKPKSREPKAAKAPTRKPQRDESISGSDSESEDAPRDDEEFGADTSGSESEEETAAERRLRLAERYLDNVRSEVEINPEGFDAEEIDRDLIAERLKEDVAESKGRIYRKLAEELEFTKARHSNFRNDSETVTAVATYSPSISASTNTNSTSAPSTSLAYVYTASKNMVLAKWKLQDLPDQQFKSKKKKKKNWKPPPPKRVPEQIISVRGDRRKSKDNSYQGHVDAILCIAASQDGRFVVTGGRDRRLIVWDSDLKPLRVFTQHRDAVCALAFRRGTNQLFSASKDRTIKVWSLNELAYVETLFGHQDEVVGLAALAQERCVSVGARDRTARLWKVVEETQLVFRGGGGSKKSKGAFMEGSMDCVAMIDEETFVTGSDSGSISLWSIHKKKPIFTLPLAHGIDKPLEPHEASAEKDPDLSIVPHPQPRWITALTTIPYSDIILSGSWDGNVRAWKLSNDKKKIEEMGAVASNPELKEGEEPTEAELQIRSMTAKGIINEISVFERGDRGKDGVCIVIATGKEHKFGSWQRKKIEGARNGCVVFEVLRVQKKTNGVVDTEMNGHEDAEED